MALAIRYLTVPFGVLRHISGRQYQANANGVCDVPFAEAEQIHVGQRLGLTGSTADRPAPTADRLNWPPMNQLFYDSTISKTVIYTGSGWVDVATGAPA
jgi:hypothetical protein